MTAGMNDHDWELLSAYLDSSLSPAETRDVEDRLSRDTDFSAALVSLRQTRAILRAVPDIKRRRNFYLTPEMAGQRTWTWLIPVFNLSSAATGLLAVILLVMNLLPSGMRAAPAQEVMMSAPVVQSTAAPANAMTEKQSAPLPTMAPARAQGAQPEVLEEAGQPADAAVAPGMSLMEPSPAVGEMPLEPEAAMPAPPAAAPLMAKGEEPAADSAAASSPETYMEQKAVAEDKALETPTPAPVASQPDSLEMAATPSLAEDLSTGVVETMPLADMPAPESSPQAMDSNPVSPPLIANKWEISREWPAGILLLISMLLAAAGFILRRRIH